MSKVGDQTLFGLVNSGSLESIYWVFVIMTFHSQLWRHILFLRPMIYYPILGAGTFHKC